MTLKNLDGNVFDLAEKPVNWRSHKKIGIMYLTNPTFNSIIGATTIERGTSNGPLRNFTTDGNPSKRIFGEGAVCPRTLHALVGGIRQPEQKG